LISKSYDLEGETIKNHYSSVVYLNGAGRFSAR